jgi:hypothetical protein
LRLCLRGREPHLHFDVPWYGAGDAQLEVGSLFKRLADSWLRLFLAGTNGNMLLERWTISYSPSSFSSGSSGSSSASRPAMDNNSVYKRLVGWLAASAVAAAAVAAAAATMMI